MKSGVKLKVLCSSLISEVSGVVLQERSSPYLDTTITPRGYERRAPAIVLYLD